MCCGALCALAALILYAHQWLPWWQACAIGALIMLATAGVIRAAGFAAPSKMAGTSRRPDSEAAALAPATTNGKAKHS